MRKAIAASILAFSGTMISGVGISNADESPALGSFPTQTACLNEGTAHVANVSAQNRGPWGRFSCDQHNDGLWYLYVLS